MLENSNQFLSLVYLFYFCDWFVLLFSPLKTDLELIRRSVFYKDPPNA